MAAQYRHRNPHSHPEGEFQIKKQGQDQRNQNQGLKAVFGQQAQAVSDINGAVAPHIGLNPFEELGTASSCNTRWVISEIRSKFSR